MFLRGWSWDLHCSASLSAAWTVGLSAPPSGFLMTPNCGGVNMLEGRDAVQCEKLMKLNKAKYKVLRPGQSNPQC